MPERGSKKPTKEQFDASERVFTDLYGRFPDLLSSDEVASVNNTIYSAREEAVSQEPAIEPTVTTADLDAAQFVLRGVAEGLPNTVDKEKIIEALGQRREEVLRYENTQAELVGLAEQQGIRKAKRKKRIRNSAVAVAITVLAPLGGIKAVDIYQNMQHQEKIAQQQKLEEATKQKKDARLALEKHYLGSQPSPTSESGWKIQLAPPGKYKIVPTDVYPVFSNNVAFVQTSQAEINENKTSDGSYYNPADTGVELTEYNYLDGSKKGIKITVHQNNVLRGAKHEKGADLLLDLDKNPEPIIKFQSDAGDTFYTKVETGTTLPVIVQPVVNKG